MVVVGGGWCTDDYSISLSPNLWIMTFDLDLNLDLGLTIILKYNHILIFLKQKKTDLLIRFKISPSYESLELTDLILMIKWKY